MKSALRFSLTAILAPLALIGFAGTIARVWMTHGADLASDFANWLMDEE